jgi:hypothetical protein
MREQRGDTEVASTNRQVLVGVMAGMGFLVLSGIAYADPVLDCQLL